MSRRGGETPKAYQPSVLVMDVALVLLQRGIETTLHVRDLPQAHQAAWTLLQLLGVEPDTTVCPCLACGGAELQLSGLNLVAASDDPGWTGHSVPGAEPGGETPGEEGDGQ